jgi:hypothetical protein
MTTTGHSGTPHASTKHSATRRDATPHDATPHSATRRDATPHYATPHDATPRDATRDEAVRAVTAALAALSADPEGAQVEAAVQRAALVLDGLEPSLTAIVLNRLLASIRDCQREGQHTSVRLRARRASAARALHLDPRRHPHPARKAS